jgi:tetratricopeptide (TPR) repeat protein
MMMFRSPKIMALLSLLGLFTAGLGTVFWQRSLDTAYSNARRAVTRGDWEVAIVLLERYLLSRPDDANARLLIAESLVSSKGPAAYHRISQAVKHLQHVASDDPLAAKAKIQEGRLSLFLLKKPAAAESALTEALRIDTRSTEANLLMWQLLDLTGRHVYCERYFWSAFETIPSEQRPSLLRDWFLSEFYPDQLYAELFQQMDITSGQYPPMVKLMVQFRESEPEATFLHAAIARYFHDAGNLKGAIELLNECPDVTAGMKDPFFVDVLFETLVDLGEPQKAETCFSEFPTPHSGYLFYRTEGMFYDYLKNNSEAAVRSYQLALETPPARFDWGLMNRLTVCLKKLGRNEESERLQTKVDYLTRQVLTVEETSELRKILSAPLRAQDASRFAEFYSKFELNKEVSAWSQYQKELEKILPDAGP